jgi:hypothetical protein
MIMSLVWSKISYLADYVEQRFLDTSLHHEVHEEYPGWYNSIFTSEKYRRAHIEIVDFREAHKIYILHVTVFPHINDSSPILGFDAVCGPNKITGAFFDFSVTANPIHPMQEWFREYGNRVEWRKQRTLPEWANRIFSDNVVAAGFLKEEQELDNFCNLSKNNLDYYLDNVGKTRISNADFTDLQNRYCRYQKQNPHTVNSMIAMGIKREVIESFVQEVLFPEV